MDPRPRALAVLALLIATCCAASPALAQSGGGPGGGGGGARGGEAARERGGFSYGGSITGRMTLFGPKDAVGAPSPPTLPSPRPNFGPGGIGTKSQPDVLEGITIPNLTPPSRAPSAAPPPHPALPSPVAPPIPALAGPVAKQALTLAAAFAEHSGKIANGVKWRIFTEQPDLNGEHLMVAESSDPTPRFELDPGGYVVHAVYGLVSTARYVSVPANAPIAETVVMPAGAVRLTALVGDVKIASDRVGFTLTREDSGVTRTVAENVRSGTLLRLPAGTYHVVSAYGDANAIVEVDLAVAPGKFVEAQVHHRAARMAMKLVAAPGGPELSDTSWTILTPGGDVIRESIGQLPPVVLSEGDYVAIARRDGKTYQQPFEVRAGFDATVELKGG